MYIVNYFYRNTILSRYQLDEVSLIFISYMETVNKKDPLHMRMEAMHFIINDYPVDEEKRSQTSIVRNCMQKMASALMAPDNPNYQQYVLLNSALCSLK